MYQYGIEKGNCRLVSTEDYGAGVCIYLEDKVNRDQLQL